MDSLENVCERINNNGGFRCIGWTKPGFVEDQGEQQAENGGGYNQPPRPKVKSGQLHYHITRIDPETPQHLNLADIQHQKFDFQAAMMRIE